MAGLSFPPDLNNFAGRIVERRLDNGISVLIYPRRTSATAHFAIAFGVGSVDEPAGLTGIAHLYEHMAFKGTSRIGTRNWARERRLLAKLDRLDLESRAAEESGKDGKGRKSRARAFDRAEKRAEALVRTNELEDIYSRNGARGLNAYTSSDATVYVVNLPANRSRLWAVLEAARLSDPVLRQFHRERNVVIEELRRYDDMPNWRLLDHLPALAFTAHPYRTPVIGWQSDLERMTRKDLEDFFQSRYRPEKAVLAVVGDVEPNRLLALIRKEFGSWRPKSPPARPLATVEPEQRGERRAVQRMQANPLLGIAWPVPTWGHPDKEALDVLAAILGRGESSRLHAALVKRRRLAMAVNAMTEFPGERYPNLLLIAAMPLSPHTPGELEGAVDRELDVLFKTGVRRTEVAKVANMLESDIFQRLSDNSQLAAGLAHTHAVTGDWRTPLKAIARYRSLLPADIIRAARAYLKPWRKNVLTILPKEPA